MLYINSITTVLPNSVTCLLFADDVKIYTVIKSDIDNVNLQIVLDRITDWSIKWQMPISVKKCSVTIYGRNALRISPYYLCGFPGIQHPRLSYTLNITRTVQS